MASAPTATGTDRAVTTGPGVTALDDNGLLLADLLDLADALAVGGDRSAPPLPPRFSDLAAAPS